MLHTFAVLRRTYGPSSFASEERWKSDDIEIVSISTPTKLWKVIFVQTKFAQYFFISQVPHRASRTSVVHSNKTRYVYCRPHSWQNKRPRHFWEYEKRRFISVLMICWIMAAKPWDLCFTCPQNLTRTGIGGGGGTGEDLNTSRFECGKKSSNVLKHATNPFSCGSDK